ncbi:MAG: DUF3667 domain-containing protein [Bacteroidota bacterium]
MDFNLTSPIPEEPGICRSCGATLTGEFCSNCGEKKFIPGEDKVRHFFGDFFSAITSLDGNFLRTAKLMITKPGVMSYQYINGRRIPFVKPMSMFFIVNVIYFLLSFGDGLNSTLYTQMNNMLWQSKVATNMVEKRIKEEKTTLKAFAIKYQEQSTEMAKLWLVLVVLYFSVPLWLINYNKKLFYFDHLTVSLEFISLAAIYMFVILPWIIVLISKFVKLSDNSFDAMAKFPLIVISWGLLYAFERNTYQQSIFRSLTKAALLVFLFYVTLMIYRITLFYITMFTL